MDCKLVLNGLLIYVLSLVSKFYPSSGKSAIALRRLQRKRKFFEDLYLHQAFAEAFNEEFETWNKLFLI